jgi:hypothetical protein
VSEIQAKYKRFGKCVSDFIFDGLLFAVRIVRYFLTIALITWLTDIHLATNLKSAAAIGLAWAVEEIKDLLKAQAKGAAQ